MTDQIHIGVEVYGLLVQGVHIFLSIEEAEKWFKEYTGLEHGTLYDEDNSCDDDYDQTKIFTLEGYKIEKIDEYLCHGCGSTYRLEHGWVPTGYSTLHTNCPYCGKHGFRAGTMISIRVKD